MFVSVLHRRATTSSRQVRFRRVTLERLEPRQLFAALPLGAMPADTAEYMLGRVAVVPVLFESNGEVDASTENWTPQAIQATLQKVTDGVQWWADALDRLGTDHSLEFVIDDTFAVNPVPTVYEPITRVSQQHTLYVGAFLEDQGFSESDSLESAIRGFNHQARERLQTDWAFTIFIVNSANDSDGQFPIGSDFSVAFAYPGGMYAVIPSTRPTSTITHEVGHIFWARDEYPGAGSWTDRRGYYDAQNWNAADNPTPGWVQEPSIMRAGAALSHSFHSYVLPESTMAMIGWRDSDGNGVFDVLDVPLELSGTGRFDAGDGVFRFTGSASAVALPNRNSSGLQNDITLNRVDRIEYRLDQGDWATALEVGKQVSEIDFELSVDDFSTIEIRAIDDRIGITSQTFSATATTPLLAGVTLGGVAFVTANGEGESGPAALSGVTATVTRIDGTPLLFGELDPDDFPLHAAPSADGVSFFGLGHVLDGQVAAVAGSTSGSQRFGFFNRQSGSWDSHWAPDKTLLVQFDHPVGRVELDAVGLGSRPGFGRLEAYDADGNLLVRTNSAGLLSGQSETMRVFDNGGRIASVRAFGHARTEIGLDRLRFGVADQQTSDPDGVFRFAGLPEGDYRLDLTPERLIHHFDASGQTITLGGDSPTVIAAGFQRVRSPWTNPNDRFDVNGDGRVEPIDALRVLNDLARGGARILRDPTQLTDFVDTSNDGEVTPLDALLVLNEIARRRRETGDGAAAAEQAEGLADVATVDRVLVGWTDDDQPKDSSSDASQRIEDVALW